MHNSAQQSFPPSPRDWRGCRLDQQGSNSKGASCINRESQCTDDGRALLMLRRDPLPHRRLWRLDQPQRVPPHWRSWYWRRLDQPWCRRPRRQSRWWGGFENWECLKLKRHFILLNKKKTWWVSFHNISSVASVTGVGNLSYRLS